MGNPTEELVNEHTSICAMIGILANLCSRMERSEEVPSVHLKMVVDFLDGFAEGCHHRKEEYCLIPSLERAGIPRRGSLIGILLAEHDLGRKLLRGMKTALLGRSIADPRADGAFIGEARVYASLLRSHITREDTVVFPMAEQRLSEKDKRGLALAFAEVESEEVGEELHEHYRAVIRNLQKHYGDT